MKLPDLGSTSAPTGRPDLGPGQGQARDDALDAVAREGMVPALADYVPAPDYAGVDEAITEGRAVVAARASAEPFAPTCELCGDKGWVPKRAIDLDGGHMGIIGYDRCPAGCP